MAVSMMTTAEVGRGGRIDSCMVLKVETRKNQGFGFGFSF